MKYGEALPQRSVQEWLPYNIDYQEIKQLIKGYTTNRPPVPSPNQKTEFEDELFDIFMDQLGRIDLFVRSKAGEIDRRIVDCERQVADIAHRQPNPRSTARITSRYAKIEREVERAGRDVQSLSRFVNVQRTAFHKLLKKYRKWTGSSTLLERFGVILESPTAFHRIDFEKNVIEVSQLLDALQDGINSLSEITAYPPASDDAVAANTRGVPSAQNVCARDRLELDTVFGTSHITDRGGKAMFWIHFDNLIELQVSLLRHLSLRTPSPPSTPNPSSPSSRRGSSASEVIEKDDNIGLIILDDLNSFSRIQNTATVDRTSKTGMRTAGQIRWRARDPNALVVVSDFARTISSPPGTHVPEDLSVRIKKKRVDSLINQTCYFSSAEGARSAEQKSKINKVREWFSEHPEVLPLAKVLSKRTRFTGWSTGGEVWAFLDRDIRMSRRISESGWVTSTDEISSVTFPHAILEIQWAGARTPEFVRELHQSHMVEVVPGFSLDVHAIAALYEPGDMTPPFWLPALQKDIRKTPALKRRHSRRESAYGELSSSSSKNTSAGTSGSGFREQTSTPATSDGAQRQPAMKKVKRRKNTSGIEHLNSTRYWNEFDDTEDQEEPYTILVRPPPSESGEIDQSLSAFIVSPITKLFSRLKKPFGKTPGQRPSERSPLIGGSHSDTDSDLDMERNPRTIHRHYATFSSEYRTARAAGHLGFLVVSFVVLMVSGSLALVESLRGDKSRRRHLGEHVALDLIVFAGVLVSLASGVVGLTLFLMRGRRAVWSHKLAVWITFVVVCAGSGVILTMLATAGIDATSLIGDGNELTAR